MNKRTKWKQGIVGAIAAVGGVAMLAGLRGQAQNRGGSAMPHYVLLEREAVVAQSPQVAAEGDVDLAAWSPDGRHAIAFRVAESDARPDPQNLEAAPVEVSVVLWNLAAKRGLTVWKHRGLPPADGRSMAGGLSWLPGTQTALLPIEWLERHLLPDAQGAQKTVETQRHALLLIDAARDQVREIPQNSWLPYAISPTKPQIVLHDSKENTARILDSSGVFGPLFALPKEPSLSVDWMPDGNALLLHWFEKPTGDKAGTNAAGAGKLIQRYARMDATTGAISPLDKMPAPIGEKTPFPVPRAGLLHVRQTSQLLSEGAARHRAHPLWLECDTKGDYARTLLCADGASAQMSPRGDAVLYLSQGVAWVAPLTRLPREAFVQSLRALAMRNGKMAATGLLMYSQDYDEVLPATADVTSPYLRDDAILDGLNYTYTGGALKDIENPSQTILGTYPGPGGVAIIYADGHVKWKDKP